MIYSKIFRAARANLLRVVKNFWRKTHEKLMIYLKNFPRCARQFVKNFIDNGMGAMLMKIVILLREN